MFHFAPNPFFENDKLTKSYTIENFLQSDQMLVDIDGCVSAQRRAGSVA